MKKYITGIRFLQNFDIGRNLQNGRVDFLLCKILKEKPVDITMKMDAQYGFTFHPESITPKELAHVLRSLAYKIQKLDKK